LMHQALPPGPRRPRGGSARGRRQAIILARGFEAVRGKYSLTLSSKWTLLNKTIGMGKTEGVALSDSVAQRQMVSASRATPRGDAHRSSSQGRADHSVAIYARVSSADQKTDLERLAEYVSRERPTLSAQWGDGFRWGSFGCYQILRCKQWSWNTVIGQT